MAALEVSIYCLHKTTKYYTRSTWLLRNGQKCVCKCVFVCVPFIKNFYTASWETRKLFSNRIQMKLNRPNQRNGQFQLKYEIIHIICCPFKAQRMDDSDELLTTEDQWNSKRINGIAFVTVIISRNSNG